MFRTGTSKTVADIQSEALNHLTGLGDRWSGHGGQVVMADRGSWKGHALIVLSFLKLNFLRSCRAHISPPEFCELVAFN